MFTQKHVDYEFGPIKVYFMKLQRNDNTVYPYFQLFKVRFHFNAVIKFSSLKGS